MKEVKYKTEGIAVAVSAMKVAQVLEWMVGQFGSLHIFQCISEHCFVAVKVVNKQADKTTCLANKKVNVLI